jgi:hypothetical protein
MSMSFEDMIATKTLIPPGAQVTSNAALGSTPPSQVLEVPKTKKKKRMISLMKFSNLKVIVYTSFHILRN